MARAIESILVIDDDERVLSAMERQFGLRRTVFTARNVDDATEIARKKRPDLAVIDMKLAGETGFDIVRRLKPEMPNTRFAIMSGYLTVDTTVEAIHAGADIVVAKPVSGGEILRRAEAVRTTIVPEHDEVVEDLPRGRMPTLNEVEDDYIACVMKDCDGNKSEAARRLGIHRTSLMRKLRRPRR
ncbi:MAG TPA: response regulator [Kofleriaceae bacterium]